MWKFDDLLMLFFCWLFELMVVLLLLAFGIVFGLALWYHFSGVPLAFLP